MNAAAELRTAPGSIPGIVDNLRRTFASGRTRSRAWRLDQLARLDRMLAEKQPELLAALEADLGKSSFEGWLAEVAIVRKDIAFTRKHLGTWMRPERVKTPSALFPAASRVLREPLGVVLIIAPWNYPLQLAAMPLTAALAAGNCAVIKPSELAPHTSDVIARYLPQYLDPEAVTVVQGGVPEATALLEQKFDHILYTGNGTVARVVMAAAAKHLTPVTLELGGKSPTIVDASCDLEVTARRICSGKYFNAGQTCIAPDYVLVERGTEEALVAALTRTLRDFFGDDAKQSKDYARIVNTRHHKRLVGLMASGTVAHGGQHDESSRYIAPTILRNVRPDSPIMQEEIFGPILPILPVDNIEEAIGFINAREKPLALYVFTSQSTVADRVLSRTSSGAALVNDTVIHAAVSELPFGGVGESGMGAYHGRFGFETFSHRKAVIKKSVRLDLPLRYPPYTESKKEWMRRLL
jgi:aldehyde dehydrogenase (NAD+)